MRKIRFQQGKQEIVEEYDLTQIPFKETKIAYKRMHLTGVEKENGVRRISGCFLSTEVSLYDEHKIETSVTEPTHFGASVTINHVQPIAEFDYPQLAINYDKIAYNQKEHVLMKQTISLKGIELTEEETVVVYIE